MSNDRVNIQAELQGQVSLTPEEHPEDKAVRLKTASRRDLLHDVTEFIVFLVLLAAIIAVGSAAAYEGLWNLSASPETKRWEQTILSAVMSGGISFVAGRKIGSK